MSATERHHHRSKPHASVRSVRWPDDLDIVRRLFQGYRDWLADHQDAAASSALRVKSGLAMVDRLITELPGAYGPPRGDILLWFGDGSLVACAALRELEPKVGEAKRVYVRSDYRGKEFGHPFVRALLDRARGLGYARLRVDTLPTMAAAIEFYQEMGFHPIPAFWPHPVANSLFFECTITEARDPTSIENQ